VKSIDPSERLAPRVGRPGLTTLLASLLPTGVFLAFDRWLGLVPAMINATLTTVALIVVRR
jgi:hypothetical protein